MKKLAVLITALVFSFVVVAQNRTQPQTTPAVKSDTEKTCADWKAEEKCPRTLDASKSCSEYRKEGKCPKINAAEAAKKETDTKSCSKSQGGCGGCKNKQQQQKQQRR
jgi:hypothetical protein